MGKPRVLPGGAAAGPADALQGGYFRGMLVAERDAVRDALAKCRAALPNHVGADEATALSLLQRDILTRELELAQLNYLIGALDERFASHWSNT